MDAHVGPLLDTERFAKVPEWAGIGNCAACGSTVHESALRGPENPAYVRHEALMVKAGRLVGGYVVNPRLQAVGS